MKAAWHERYGGPSVVEVREIPNGSRVLYAHLGGQPALSAYAHTPGLGG